MRFAGMGIVTAVAVLACASVARADERKYTYSYEAKTLPQGGLEFEQWATLRAHRDVGKVWFLDLREEIEYGVTDRFTVAGYLNFEVESIKDVPGEKDETELEFETVSVELKYKLTDPVADPIGVLFYGEVGVGGDEQEVELKLIVNKQLGPINLVYNLIFELEREKDHGVWENESMIANTFGVSFDLMSNWAVGAELVVRTLYEQNFKEREITGASVGPVVHYFTKSWWITGTFLVLTRDPDAFEKYEARIIFGINF
jgi:opacity protein-like surface antigen